MNRTIWNGQPIFTTEAQRAQRGIAADVDAGASADLPGASEAETQTPLCDLCGSVVKSPRRSVRAAFTLIEVMIVIAIILLPLMFGNKLGRWQGALLCSAYLAYIALVIQRG